jgi:alpha-glucosidase
MEWAADGHFEDHPSMVFLNRRLAVPKFRSTHKGRSLTIETSALRLHYTLQGDGKFNPSDLTITRTARQPQQQ